MIRSTIAKAFASIAAVIGLALPFAAQAETPALGWTAAHLTSDPSCIRTDGTLVYAYAAGNYSANGVTFNAISAGDFPCSDISWTRTGLNTGKIYTVSGVSGGYGDILSHFWSINGSTQTVTLKNLTVGHRYLVQIIGCNQSNNDHNSDVYVEGFDTERMRCGAAADGWEYGGTLIGVFETTGTEYSFNLKFYNQSADWVAYNAIQVRELSGGDDPDPTVYAVSWTGGANAGVVAKVDGAAISSGANVEDGKSVVFAVTPNTNYEFAEASYQDWTLTDGVLSRTVTVDGAAVDVTIPNATEKTTPPGPTEGWTAAAMTADPSSIRKDGVLVYAYAYGDYTANGVEFRKAVATDATAKTITNDDLTWALTGGMLWQKSNGFADVEDTGYKNLMGHCWGCQNTDPHTIELRGLTQGSTYLVQIIGCNYTQDNDGKIWVQETAGQTFGDGTPYMYTGGTHDGDDWTYGGSLIGVFTAESSTKSITLKYARGSWAGFNAIQVRDLSGVGPTPTVVDPSIGSLTATVNGMAATFDLSGVVLGTDSHGESATSYKVEYAIANSHGSIIKDGTVLAGQTAATASFDISGFSDPGTYTCTVTITTDKETSASKSVEFTLVDEPDPPHELGWTAAPMTTDPASVRTDGVLCYAYACNGDRTVNGVEFLRLDPTDNDNLAWNVSQTASTGSLPGFEGDYNELLKNQWWAGDGQLTLRNLIPGHDYLVQVIGCRYNHADTKSTKVSVLEAGDDSIFMKAAGDDEWIYGGTLIGVFKAADMTQTFHFKKFDGSWSAFNAVQVRDLSLTDDDAVAIIERGATTNFFFTIADAYKAAAAGETIKLVKDADFPANEPAFSKGVDLDLDGYVITRKNIGHEKVVDSDTVITNGVFAFDAGVYPSDLNVPFKVRGAVTLTLAGVSAGDSAGNEPLCLVGLEDGAGVVLAGGGVYHAGSLFKSVSDDNTMTISGGRYVLRGWFMPASKAYEFANNQKGDLKISGGAFSIAPDARWIESGYRILHDVSDTETPYHVVPAAEAPYTEPGWTYHYADAEAAEAAHVAKRDTAEGVRYYTSLLDAVNAANNSGTVTLVADIPALDRGVTLSGTVTLDGAGHTVKVAHPYVNDGGFVANDFSFDVLKMVSVWPADSDVVLRNVSLTGGGLLDGDAGDNGLPVIDNFGTLLMENVTVTRSNGAVHNEQGAVLFMDNCRIVRNCRFCAGGLFNRTGAFAVMNRTSLSENRSLGQAGGGGACENGGTLFVNNCVIANNSSTEVGGAINNYGSDGVPELYLMNTTVSGNFSSIFEDTNAFEHDKGGGIGLRGKEESRFYVVNSLFGCNYQTDTRKPVPEWGDIRISDICSISGSTSVKLYYSVVAGMRAANPVERTEVRELGELEASTNVFNAYYASGRVYENAKPTAMEILGAQLVAKDDGSLDAALARYAPIKRVDNGDGTYTYGQAVYGASGVYTYFDPSDWKNRIVKMSYAPVVGTPDFFDYESAGEMTAVGDLPPADASHMVTNYYESVRGRSFGVAGASGWLMEDVVYYTVRLAREPENGTASGISLYGETYEEGTVVTLTATPGYAREFLGWYEVDAEGNETLIDGSAQTVWKLTVDKDYVLVPKFSDLQEILTPAPRVHVQVAETNEAPLFPISVTTKWMTDHYENFVETLAGKTKDEVEAWLTEILEQTSPGTGRKMWQDYVLGTDPDDVNARIWINSPQYRSAGHDLLRMEMNRLSPVSGSGFIVNYRLDKKLGSAAAFARDAVNATGSYDINVGSGDPSGLYRIDVLFIPEGRSTSEEYVSTVNTAGVLRVSSTASRAAISVPWTKLQPSGSDPVRAVNLVKTTNLTPDDVLYVYDFAKRDYRAWKMDANGNWSPLSVFTIDQYGQVDWSNPSEAEAAGEGSEVARGLGIWLERANTNDFIYLCGQYDPATVSTTLAPGFNLVANPYPTFFDASTLAKPTATGPEGDRIVIPTAEAPVNACYKDDAWKAPRNEVISFVNPVTRETMAGVKTVWATDGLTLSAGLAFWYFNAGSESVELTWPVTGE